MSVVLDASALLALLQREPGSGQVAEVIDGAFMSTVNWTEVAAMAVKSGADVTGLQGELQAIGLILEAFTASMATAAGRLWPIGKPLGLSLADRACLALAMERKLPVLTTDRVWSQLQLGIEVRQVR